jgi:lipopolysaccharide transport system permease protein
LNFTALLHHRELIIALAWKNISLRYKQAYFGVAWAIMRPLMLTGIFLLLRTFIGIETGAIPYPVLAYAAVIIWTLFQDTVNEGVNSIVGNAHLIRKIYFPREVFPLTATVTKLIEFAINFAVLLLLMAWYGLSPTIQVLWVPVIVVACTLAGLVIALAGSAINVYYRDVGAAIPLLLTLFMYVSPIIYPLHLVQQKLLVGQAAGDWSRFLYGLYVLNPVAGIVDSFQRVMLQAIQPDPTVLLPGVFFSLILLPFSYALFKRAEARFADFV